MLSIHFLLVNHEAEVDYKMLTTLDVPVVLQQGENGCLQAAVKMVLDYYIQCGNTNLPSFSISEINKICGIRDDNALAIEDLAGLNDRLHKYGYTISSGYNNMRLGIKRLNAPLNAQIPPIVVIDEGRYLEELRHRVKHAIVVKSISVPDQLVIANDPWTGERRMSLGRFMEAWNDVWRMIVLIKKVQLPKLTDFIKGDKK